MMRGYPPRILAWALPLLIPSIVGGCGDDGETGSDSAGSSDGDGDTDSPGDSASGSGASGDGTSGSGDSADPSGSSDPGSSGNGSSGTGGSGTGGGSSGDSGEDSEGGSDGTEGETEPVCPTEDRATPYEPGWVVEGRGGQIEVELIESTPAPPIKGDNRWHLRIRDLESGETVEGLDVSASPFMPDHDHGTPIVAELSELGGGEYALEPVNLFMQGYWRVRIDASGGSLDDYAIFPICVD